MALTARGEEAMKPHVFILCITAALTNIAHGAAFNFDAVTGYKPAPMLLTFAEACFLKSDNSYYQQAFPLSDCVGNGGNFAEYLNGTTSSLADRCSRLNVLKYYYHDPETTQSSFTFKLSYDSLDRETIVDARAACAELVRQFTAMPFSVYGKTTKECRRMIGIVVDCLRVRQTPTGVIVGFFVTLSANEISSQCETLVAAQAQPPNLICASPLPRVSPDLRFRSVTSLSACPPLLPVANPASCQLKHEAASITQQTDRTAQN
jgi:hypothetical protein